MDKGGKVRAVGAVVVLVMAMLVGQPAAASFRGCYAKCLVFCMVKPPHSVRTCGFKCLRKCILSHSPLEGIRYSGHDFCKLGCASASCVDISTDEDPGEEKVESCVGSCSELCNKNYLSPP